jgi:hypothetical protein
VGPFLLFVKLWVTNEVVFRQARKEGWVFASIYVKYNALVTKLAIAGILLKKVLAIK